MSFAQYEALLGRYDALVQLVAQMKREGFTTHHTEAPTVALGPELPVSVRKVIANLAEPGSANYRHLTKEAMEMQALGFDEAVIIERIDAGEPAEL